MVNGEDLPISLRGVDVSAGGVCSDNSAKSCAMFSSIGQLINSSRTNNAHLLRDIQPDADLTRIVVERRKNFISEKYQYWTEGLARVALGVVLMSTAKEINVQGQVHFLHLAQGDNMMRAHDGNTFLYENGAFRLFKGIIPESTIQRCADFSSYVEGCLWCIEQSCKSRSELDIYDALDNLFRAITAEAIRRPEESACAEGAIAGGPPRGVKRKLPDMSLDNAEIPHAEGPLDEGAIYEALKETSLDKWVTSSKGSCGKTWAAQEAVNCLSMSKELSSRMETAKIIPFYAEYMEVERSTSLGLSLEDCCLIYEPQSASERQGRIMRQVAKGPEHNIYTYIERPLSDPVIEDALSRVGRFLNTTFCDNAWALECSIAGAALALMGQNVDMAFWSIGKGGVGKSLFSTLIRNAMSPMRGFFDCASLYMGDELRKTLGNSVGFCVSAAQEGD